MKNSNEMEAKTDLIPQIQGQSSDKASEVSKTFVETFIQMFEATRDKS